MSQPALRRLLVLATALAVPSAYGQTPAAPLVFEVATIKPSDPSRNGTGFTIKAGKFEAYGFTIKDLIGYAYTINHEQIVDAPKWADSEKYDILGKPEKPGPLVIEDAKVMVQGLLADRFGLKFHNSTREMPVYVLSVGKGGPKLKVRTDPDEPRGVSGPNGKLQARATLLSFLIFVLQRGGIFDRPVLDQTGLTGRYDFDLTWSSNPGQSNDAARSDRDAPDLFTAFQEELGLKLEAKRAPAPVIVVDSAEKPSDN